MIDQAFDDTVEAQAIRSTMPPTFATLALSAGEHYMQVSKWLGHSSYLLTLTTYADYIREDELAGPKLARPAADAVTNVVDLERRKANLGLVAGAQGSFVSCSAGAGSGGGL